MVSEQTGRKDMKEMVHTNSHKLMEEQRNDCEIEKVKNVSQRHLMRFLWKSHAPGRFPKEYAHQKERAFVYNHSSKEQRFDHGIQELEDERKKEKKKRQGLRKMKEKERVMGEREVLQEGVHFRLLE
jgi:hypothetical protein